MFPPPDTLFVETKTGNLTARPLIETLPAAPTNHQQHLFFGWRQRLVGALMHDHVLVPEGASDGAWLEALQTALEMRQDWRVEEIDPTRFGTFVGVVPTSDAKVQETFEIVSRVHSCAAVLLDGDDAGRGYFEVVRLMNPPPRYAVFWPEGWAIEHIVTWIATAGGDDMRRALGGALVQRFATEEQLTDFLLAMKSYAPTHETVAVTLMANQVCRRRAARLLGGIADVLRGVGDPSLFQRNEADSTANMQAYVFTP